jgi:hypothetical protein
MNAYYGRRLPQLADPFRDQPQQQPSIGQHAMLAAFDRELAPMPVPPPPSGGGAPTAQSGQSTVPGSPRVNIPAPPVPDTPASSALKSAVTGTGQLTNGHYYGPTTNPEVRDWRVGEITNYYTRYLGRQPSPQELSKVLTDPKFNIYNVHQQLANSPDALMYAANAGAGDNMTPGPGGQHNAPSPHTTTIPEPPAEDTGYFPGGPSARPHMPGRYGEPPASDRPWNPAPNIPWAPFPESPMTDPVPVPEPTPEVTPEVTPPPGPPPAAGPAPFNPGPAPLGWDDPEHDTIKYEVGRIINQFPHTPAGLDQAWAQIHALYPNATRVDGDEIDFHDGYGPVDLIQASEGPAGGTAWQWIVDDGSAAAPAGNGDGDGIRPNAMTSSLFNFRDLGPRAMSAGDSGQSYSSGIIQYLLRQLAMGNSLFPTGGR